MKVKMTQEFDAPLDVVVRAKDERFEHTDKIDGLNKLNFTDVQEDDKTKRTTRPFDVDMSKTPAAVRKMLPPDMFSFVEESVWDKEKKQVEWEMKSKAKNKLTWKGVTAYRAKDGDKTERHIDCTIKVKVPIIGDAIEKTIASGFKKSMEKEYRTIDRMAEMITNGEV